MRNFFLPLLVIRRRAHRDLSRRADESLEMRFRTGRLSGRTGSMHDAFIGISGTQIIDAEVQQDLRHGVPEIHP